MICVSDCLFSVIFIFLTPGFSYIIASFIVKIALWGHIWFKTIKLSQILPKICNLLANFVWNFSDIFFRQFFQIADECYWKKLTFFSLFFSLNAANFERQKFVWNFYLFSEKSDWIQTKGKSRWALPMPCLVPELVLLPQVTLIHQGI